MTGPDRYPIGHPIPRPYTPTETETPTMPMMTRKQAAEAERAEAIERLRALLPPGTECRTLVRHVARSGMTRWIDVYDPDMQRITYDVGIAAGYSYSDHHHALTVGGCGMDMGFAVVYSLSRTLYREGFDCIGGDLPERERGRVCPANDHVNRGDGGNLHHADGGYALRQRWI